MQLFSILQPQCSCLHFWNPFNPPPPPPAAFGATSSSSHRISLWVLWGFCKHVRIQCLNVCFLNKSKMWEKAVELIPEQAPASSGDSQRKVKSMPCYESVWLAPQGSTLFDNIQVDQPLILELAVWTGRPRSAGRSLSESRRFS